MTKSLILIMTFMLAACDNEVELYDKYKKYCTERNGFLVVREVKSGFAHPHQVFKEFSCVIDQYELKL
jgi:hypothetical protein